MTHPRNAVATIVAVASLILATSCKEDLSTALPRLTKELDAKESSVRNRAALDLAGYGPDGKAAVPALVRLLRDPNSGVRSSAAFALRSIGTPEAEKALDAYQGGN